MRANTISLFLHVSVMLFIPFCVNAATAVALRVQSRLAPIGLTEIPTFSWKLRPTGQHQSQIAYRVLVATSLSNLNRDIGDAWDSGKINTDQQLHINYTGKALASSRKYFWKVKLWGKGQLEGDWSIASSWVNGIIAEGDWKAKWITHSKDVLTQPLFAKRFGIRKRVKHAVAHISGLGYFEMYLNGKKVGDHVLDPAQTNYDDYALYVSHELTSKLRSDNILCIMLGDGFYHQDKVWGKQGLVYGRPMFLLQIEIFYEDGTKETIISDQNWISANGPVLAANVYAGEIYDARLEPKGWNKGDLDISDWKSVSLIEKNTLRLRSQDLPPIKKMAELPIRKIWSIAPKTVVVDLGQNYAGWIRLKVKGKRGDTIKMGFAEEIDKNGKLDFSSTGIFATGVKQQLTYICSGEGIEIWEPRFTYHGFRYVEVTGLSDKQTPRGFLTGIVLHNAVQEVGNFSCSDPQINKLHAMAKWTLRSNLFGVPTDCPTREKCGWLGDAHVMASMSMYNYDMEQFWIKYLYDIRSSSRDTLNNTFTNRNTAVAIRTGVKPKGIPLMIAPGKRSFAAASIDWGTSIVQLPWLIYLNYGNRQILYDFYKDMQQWVSYCETTLAKDHIVYEGLGDWCPPNGKKECPIELSSTAFYYRDLNIMDSVAGVMGRLEDKRRYAKLSQAVKTAFINKFYQQRAGTFGSQTANAMALDFGLVHPGYEKKVSDAIASDAIRKHEGFLNTGIFGLQRIFNALGNYGNAATAHGMLTKKGKNSFAQMWSKYNATTLWEVLPTSNYYEQGGVWPARQSHNHPMQAGFDAWFFQGVLGINPDPQVPGYKKIILKPQLTSQLTWAKGSLNTAYGEIKSDWKNSGNQFSWQISVPPNATATIHLPAAKSAVIKINGRYSSTAIDKSTANGESAYEIFELCSGNYHFTVTKK